MRSGDLVDPAPADPGIGLACDAFGRLVLRLPGGSEHVGVTPVRAFPLSAPEEHIAFVDERGREVYELAHLELLSSQARALLEADLARREFVPVIAEILSISSGAEPTTWRVRTDRGEVEFSLPSEESVRVLGDGGVLITDALGVRYRIPSLRHLGRASRRRLARYA